MAAGRGGSLGASQWIALYGPLVLALYFVATTRWGSFMLPGPPYIGDLALGTLIAHRAWLLARGNGPRPLIGLPAGLPAALLIVYALAWLALGGNYSVDALRDIAPYMYAVLALLGCSSARIDAAVAERLVFGALILHALWYTLVAVEPGVVSIGTPGDSTVSIFEIRADVDGAMFGVLAAMALRRTLAGRSRLLSAGLATWALYFVFENQSRASLGAMLCVVAFAVLHFLIMRRRGLIELPADSSQRFWGRPAFANAVLAVLAVLLAPALVAVLSGSPAAIERTTNVISQNQAGAKELAELEERARWPSSGGVDGSGEGGSSKLTPNQKREIRKRRQELKQLRAELALVDTGQGTFEARLHGWEKTVEWIGEEPSRVAIGVGFGPHYMQLSGADVAFLGPAADPSVRAIHNFGVNTLARLGVVGFLLLAAIVLAAVYAAFWLPARAGTTTELDLFASLLVIAIPVVAMLGVVFESPFGAIPYFWAVGYLSARLVEEGGWRPVPLPRALRRAELRPPVGPGPHGPES